MLDFTVRYEEFKPLLEFVKSIKGRVYNNITKKWYIPLTKPNIQLIMSKGFRIHHNLDDFLNPTEFEEEDEPQAHIDKKKVVVPYKLRDYQWQAIRFAEYTNWRCMIALAPRLGKSVVALSGIMLHDFKKILIVSPVSPKVGWAREIKNLFNEDAYFITGTTPYKLPEHRFYIINWDILAAWLECLPEVDYVIGDESHRASGDVEEVQCANAFDRYTRNVQHIVLLTGTPINTKRIQLQSQLGYLSDEFRRRYWFAWRYCSPRKDPYTKGWIFDGEARTSELRHKTRELIFRRTKHDVFTELPKETHTFIPMEINETLYHKEMAQLEREAIEQNLSEEEIDERKCKFESLSYTEKRSQIIQWISDYLEINEKLVVYVWHRAVLADLMEKFGKIAVAVSGSTRNKQKYIDEFNENSKIKLFIGQIKSVKEGISLSASDTIFFAELGGASGGDIVQASERTWLPHLMQEGLYYYYAVGDGSFEEGRIKELHRRAVAISKTLDKNPTSSVLFGKSMED